MDERLSIPHGAGGTLRLRVPPDPRFAGYVRQRVETFTAVNNVPQADGAEFVTAVSEALANAVEHSRTKDEIEVACWLVDGNQLLATVVDSGVGFDATAVIEDSALPEPLAERGRGLPLMRRFTDLFALRSEPGAGTRVVLGRFLRYAEQNGDGAAITG